MAELQIPFRLEASDVATIADAVVTRLQPLFQLLLSEEQTMSADTAAALAALNTQVQANNQVTQSAITLINGLADQIRANATDPVALMALADELSKQDSALADAVVANTPAPPAPQPAPEPAPQPAPEPAPQPAPNP